MCGEERPVSWLGNGFKSQVMVFKAKAGGTVQANFDKDSVFWANSDRLVFEDLEEFVVKAKGEVVGEGSFRAERENFLKPVRF